MVTRMTGRRDKTVWLAGWVLLAFLAFPAWGQKTAAVPKEYQVKAAFLFHFTQFVKWPAAAFAGSAEPFCIGILGQDPFDGLLDDTVLGEKVEGRPLVVRRYGRIEDVGNCQILFVSRSERERLGRILGALRGKNILTVGDTEGFTRDGGIILFRTEKNKIHFEVNLEAAKEVNLSISSKMLRLAKITGREGD